MSALLTVFPSRSLSLSPPHTTSSSSISLSILSFRVFIICSLSRRPPFGPPTNLFSLLLLFLRCSLSTRCLFVSLLFLRSSTQEDVVVSGLSRLTVLFVPFFPSTDSLLSSTTLPFDDYSFFLHTLVTFPFPLFFVFFFLWLTEGGSRSSVLRLSEEKEGAGWLSRSGAKQRKRP